MNEQKSGGSSQDTVEFSKMTQVVPVQAPPVVPVQAPPDSTATKAPTVDMKGYDADKENNTRVKRYGTLSSHHEDSSSGYEGSSESEKPKNPVRSTGPKR